MPAASIYVLFPGVNHLRTTGTDYMTLCRHQHLWLAGGYDLEMTFLEVASMVVTWWIVAFLPSQNM